MTDFSFVRDQRVKEDATTEHTLIGIEMPGTDEYPVLIGRYAGESNKPYYNALIKKQSKQASKTQAALKANIVTPEMIAMNRSFDLELYPRHIIVGWRNVHGADGKPVEFNVEDCAKFLEAIPTEHFDEVRSTFGNMFNFSSSAPTLDDAVTEGND